MSRLFVGSDRRYSDRSIQAVPCARCKKPSAHQWQVCANGNRWQGICLKCDVALNTVVLKFMRHPNASKLIRKYAALRGESE